MRSLPGFDTDVYALPDLRTQQMALYALVAIRDGTAKGEPLGKHVETGDLSDEAVAVGSRANLAAYLTAAKRLGRS